MNKLLCSRQVRSSLCSSPSPSFSFSFESFQHLAFTLSPSRSLPLTCTLSLSLSLPLSLPFPFHLPLSFLFPISSKLLLLLPVTLSPFPFLFLFLSLFLFLFPYSYLGFNEHNSHGCYEREHWSTERAHPQNFNCHDHSSSSNERQTTPMVSLSLLIFNCAYSFDSNQSENHREVMTLTSVVVGPRSPVLSESLAHSALCLFHVLSFAHM